MKSSAIPLLPLWAFVACSMVNFTFTIIIIVIIIITIINTIVYTFLVLHCFRGRVNVSV